MGLFAYRAIDATQTAVEGVITADSPRQARDELRGKGLVIREIVSRAESQRAGFWRSYRSNASQLTATVRELATLLSVGVSVDEAIGILAEQHRGRYQQSLLQLQEQVTAGTGLAAAMDKQPFVFDELTRRMVEVGENAGNLDQVLALLADYHERSLQLKDRITSALLYPAIVFSASLAVALFLMTVVVPMLLASLLDAGRALPWPTRILKSISDVLVGHGAKLGITVLVLGVVAAWLARRDGGKRLVQRLMLRTPLLGSMVRRQSISRVAMVIATLMRSGIEYLNAAEIAAKTSRNLPIRDALRSSNQRISAGVDIGVALSESAYFPPVVVHVFSVGQASGRLEEMLDRLAENYDRQVASLSNRLAAVLEPILIIVLAVFVGFILFATLLPILEAGNVLQ